MRYTTFLFFFTFLILFFQLIEFFQLDYRIFALSPSFERQEITDTDNDWIFWPHDLKEDKVILQDNTLQSIPIAKNETDCKEDLGFSSSPQIKSISYMRKGDRFNTTMWLSSDLIEYDLQKNKLTKDNYQNDSLRILWRKIKFTMAIDINSRFNQGTDYRIELVNERINSTSLKWAEIVYEISANGDKKEIIKKLFNEFPYVNKNFIEL